MSGVLPEHGSDFGLFMHAEVLGMHKVIFVKDEDGMYTRDPKRDATATRIPHTTLAALLENMPEELPLDRQLFEAWTTSRHVREVQIVSGLRHGDLTRALMGEAVGTVIVKEQVHD